MRASDRRTGGASEPGEPSADPELIDRLERRAVAFCLAGRLASWPDEESGVTGKELAQSLDDGDDDDERRLAQLASGLDCGRLEPEYVELFEGSRRCPMHETEYGRMRGMSKGNDLADVAGFYAAFGLERADTPAARQMVDHLGVELEFYGVLLAKQAAVVERGDNDGALIVADARAKFLNDHLGRFAAAVAEQPAVRAAPQYGPVLAAVAALVDAECLRLDVKPPPLDFYADAAEPEALCCGGSASK